MIVVGVVLLLATQVVAPPAVLEISAKGCKVKLDGKRMPLDALRERVQELGRDKREVQLRPETDVTPDCLIKVASAIREGHP
jgi:biopolymer transport protein ExbD